MTATLRRLNDRERYWGLTWPSCIAVFIAGGLLYAAVRLSPLPPKATITIVVLLLAFLGSALAGASGQALSPARHLLALSAYHRRRKRLTLAERPDGQGLVLSTAPLTHTGVEPAPVAASLDLVTDGELVS